MTRPQPNVTFHFTAVGNSRINQVETWFADHHRHAIRRAAFAWVNALIHRIGTRVEHRNADAKPFPGTATADEILAKVRWTETRSTNSSTTTGMTATGSRDTRPPSKPYRTYQ
jgi:hypothetical protein